jgi:hypothetical protein
MSSKKNSHKSFQYKNLVLTNHAKGRILNRSLTLENLFQTIKFADNQFDLNENKTKFIKNISGRRYQVIAKYLADDKQWLIISAWVRGEDDKEPLVWQIISLPFKLVWRGVVLLIRHIS